jgi:hypothetical protein
VPSGSLLRSARIPCSTIATPSISTSTEAKAISLPVRIGVMAVTVIATDVEAPGTGSGARLAIVPISGEHTWLPPIVSPAVSFLKVKWRRFLNAMWIGQGTSITLFLPRATKISVAPHSAVYDAVPAATSVRILQCKSHCRTVER